MSASSSSAYSAARSVTARFRLRVSLLREVWVSVPRASVWGSCGMRPWWIAWWIPGTARLS